MLSEFDDEVVVTFNGANNAITFTTNSCTVAGTKPFNKNADVEDADPEHYFKPGDLVTIEIPGDKGSSNIGRYIVNTIDTTNFSNFTIDTTKNTAFTASTISDKTLRFKSTNLLDDETSLVTDHVIDAEDEIYALTTTTNGEFASYNASLKKVTRYDDVNGTTLSGALTNTGDPRFFDDTLATSDDGATFVDVTASALPRDDILFSGSEQSFQNSKRKLNSSAHEDNYFLASVTTSGKMKHDKEVTKNECWLSKNRYTYLSICMGKMKAFSFGRKIRRQD